MSPAVPVCAVVDAQGKVRALSKKQQPREQVTEKQVTSPAYLARLAMRVLAEIADLRRRFAPRRVDFEDVLVDATGTTLNQFPHNFGGRVRWWVVDAAGAVPALVRDASTDASTLRLTSTVACVVTIRIEEAG